MANPDNIVSVDVTIADAAVTAAGFGTPLVMTYEAAFGPELVRTYSSTTAMTTDGFDPNGAAVQAVTAILAQNPKVSSVKVGRRTSTPQAQTRVLTVAQVYDSTEYTVTINGTAFTFTSDASATNLEIAAGLDALINAGAEPVTSTDNLDGTFTLVADVAGTAFGLSHSVGLITQDDTTTATGGDGIVGDYDDIKEEDNDFYGIIVAESSSADIVLLAASVEADRKILGVQCSDSDILADTGGNVAETLHDAGYHHTYLMWSMDNFEFANAAWMGKQFPKDPGSATWAFKSLSGVTIDTLTDTELGNLEANDANHYTSTKGLSMTLQGTMASGRFIDIQRGIDWLTVRMQERILNLLANSDKIPFTAGGITALENEVRAQLEEAVGNNVITTGYTVTPPAIEDVSTTDKAQRVLGDLDFAATLSGAIHQIQIAGTVSV